jgi:hypothetical protein
MPGGAAPAGRVFTVYTPGRTPSPGHHPEVQS